jgi:hypothetical protein
MRSDTNPLHNACVVIAGASPQQNELAANFHVDRLPPRCLAFGIELNSFRTIDEEDVVSYWFLVGDHDIADFSKYLAGKYGRQVGTFMPTSLEEARKIQVEFGRTGERFPGLSLSGIISCLLLKSLRAKRFI